jgi:hypothetical protein
MAESAHPELPLACTLDAADGADRSRRWRQLTAEAAPVARRTGGRLEVRYQPGPGVLDELRALAAAESECCPFVAWAVTEQAGQPTLVVSAPPDAPGNIEPIAALFRA